MEKEELRHHLNWDACIECGQCLVNCRYMDLCEQDALREIHNINTGHIAGSEVLKKCISCYACNAFCPRDAHPYERIHYNWDYRYKHEGLPKRTRYLMPTKTPNFRQNLRFTPQEQDLHRKWASETPPARVCLYPGCNLMAMPLLANGMIFDILPVWGRWDLCCGEMYFRMGLLDPVKKIADRLSTFYRDKDIDEMVFVCPAGYNMFTNVLPQQFGAQFHFKTTFFTDWLLNQIENGVIHIEKPLTGSVVMHDSCHARILGNDFMNRQRSLLRLLGLAIYETPYNRAHGLCCGMAAGCNKYSAWDLLVHGMRALRALNKAAGDEVAMYCTGCLLTFEIMRLFNPWSKSTVHCLEYVRTALGEKVPRRHTSRAFQILAGIARHALPDYLSREKFYI